MIAFNSNLIAYEYYKNLYVPNEVYTSGEKEETNLIDKYTFNREIYPVIAIKDDIINKDGYGLKHGFYNVAPEEGLDFLLLFQSGNLKAKIPVVKMEVFESVNAKTEKVQKMSYRKYKKIEEKKYREYMKGQNPDEVDYKDAKIYYDREKNAYILIYSANNYELVGVIKL